MQNQNDTRLNFAQTSKNDIFKLVPIEENQLIDVSLLSNKIRRVCVIISLINKINEMITNNTI